jgi:hypothetical protein
VQRQPQLDYAVGSSAEPSPKPAETQHWLNHSVNGSDIFITRRNKHIKPADWVSSLKSILAR